MQTRTIIHQTTTVYHVFDQKRWAETGYGLRGCTEERLEVVEVDAAGCDKLVEDSDGNLYRVQGRFLRFEDVLTPAQAKAMDAERERHSYAIDGIWADGRLTLSADRNRALKLEGVRHRRAVEAIREGLEVAPAEVDNNCDTGASVVAAEHVERRRAQRQQRQEVLADLDNNDCEPAPLRALESDELLDVIPVRPIPGRPGVLEVRSESDPTKTHVVDLSLGGVHSCTCGDFENRGARHRPGDPGRKCKHFAIARLSGAVWDALQRMLDTGVSAQELAARWKRLEDKQLKRRQIAQALIQAAAQSAGSAQAC